MSISPLAMAIVVIVIVQWYSIHVARIPRLLAPLHETVRAAAAIGRIFFTPLNIIEEIAKPLSLALRLFGNIFGGRGHGLPAHAGLHGRSPARR